MSAAAVVPAGPPKLAATGIRKRFGHVSVLEDVSLTLRPGSFHALLGENGAGKSTLVKCIMGYYLADAGRILVDDAEVRIASPRDAQALGIGMVYQHFTLVPNMSVAENLVMARARLPAVIDWRKEQGRLRDFMAHMPFQIDPARAVRSLAAGERQKLEILKQLYLGNRIVILDEPTSVLTPSEADEVLGMLRGMARDGRVSVLMISHKFREVMAFADEVTILRRGRVAGTASVADVTVASMAAMMVGGEPPSASASRSGGEPGPARLALEAVEALDARGVGALRGVTLEARAGEIVGIAGVSGNGQDELLEVLAGQREIVSGAIDVDGAPYGGTRAEARARGLRCLPEEPLRNACVATMTVSDNIGFRTYDQPPNTALGFVVKRGELRRRAAECVSAYRIKTASVDAPMASLSGGNVQRSVLARELQGTPRILVVANPCFGLDFAAVAEIRTRLLEARNAGVAVLLISADLDEIFALSDRILVISGGKIVHETPVADADVAVIGRFMAGHGHG
ncbi:MAG TPA: ABC transporter ATP-binding protein [Polyangiaceae bacterium]|jgi:simple sugar transport system ATP-binding protein